jgi:beta-lactam-binding protein with PASTA domain
LSAYEHVTLYLPRARHGLIPQLVGLSVSDARAKLAPLKVRVRLAGGRTGAVIAQTPLSGVAAGPGMKVVLTVRRAKTAG